MTHLLKNPTSRVDSYVLSSGFKKEYEINQIEAITPKMWSKIKSYYPQLINISLSDLNDFNIVRILFREDATFEISSIFKTSSRILTLPITDKNKYIIHQVV